jgi:hypothetical protein
MNESNRAEFACSTLMISRATIDWEFLWQDQEWQNPRRNSLFVDRLRIVTVSAQKIVLFALKMVVKLKNKLNIIVKTI